VTNGRAETLRILANAFDELEQLRCRLRDDSEHVRHAMDAARNEERAAVVAWLRAEAEAAAQTYTVQAGEWANRIDALADLIERGEHRREEGA